MLVSMLAILAILAKPSGDNTLTAAGVGQWLMLRRRSEIGADGTSGRALPTCEGNWAPFGEVLGWTGKMCRARCMDELRAWVEDMRRSVRHIDIDCETFDTCRTRRVLGYVNRRS
jgi:hypothetical protein